MWQVLELCKNNNQRLEIKICDNKFNGYYKQMILLDILLLTLEKYIFDTIDCVIDKYDVNCI